jgi:hypothetical protein
MKAVLDCTIVYIPLILCYTTHTNLGGPQGRPGRLGERNNLCPSRDSNHVFWVVYPLT